MGIVDELQLVDVERQAERAHAASVLLCGAPELEVPTPHGAASRLVGHRSDDNGAARPPCSDGDVDLSSRGDLRGFQPCFLAMDAYRLLVGTKPSHAS
jgi:hypothetical protein